MRPARPTPRLRMPVRLRITGAATCFLAILISGCTTPGNPDYAPVAGTLGGMALGALIGSASGDAGTGAVIGGMLGRVGGEIVRIENAPTRAAADARLLGELPATLREAARFDASLRREYSSLARRRATAPGPDALVARALASRKLQEADAWLQFLAQCDAAIARTIRAETRHPGGQLGKLLHQRDQLRHRIHSLKTSRSWLPPLAY